MTSFDLDVYLERIGRSRIPLTRDGLFDLQKAQLAAIRFENIDPFLGRTPALDLPSIVDKTVLAGRGGYCYELNLLLEAAMTALGFAVRRSLARVRRGAPSGGPRSHLTLRTEIDGRRYLVDAGFGGPGSLAPLAIDDPDEQATPSGVFRLTLDPVSGERVVERRTANGWYALYGFDEAYVGDMDVVAANYLSANWPSAPFPDHLLLNGYQGADRIGVYDRSLTIETPSGEERRRFRDADDFAETVLGLLKLRVDRQMLGRVWERIEASDPST